MGRDAHRGGNLGYTEGDPPPVAPYHPDRMVSFMTTRYYDVILDPIVSWDAHKLREPLRFLRGSVGLDREIEVILPHTHDRQRPAAARPLDGSSSNGSSSNGSSSNGSSSNGSSSNGSTVPQASDHVLRLSLTEEEARALHHELRGKDAWEAGIVGFRALADGPSPDKPPGSITVLIHGMREGDQDAIGKALDRVKAAMSQMAAKNMHVHDPIADEEDMIYGAFSACVLGIAKGRYDLKDRSDLFRLLATVIRNNCRDHDRRALAGIRDRNRLVDLAHQHAQRSGVTHQQALQEIAANIATPEVIASFEEGIRLALQKLSRSEWIVAVMRLRGHSNKEIAAKLEVSERTVERKLSDVRKCWTKLI